MLVIESGSSTKPAPHFELLFMKRICMLSRETQLHLSKGVARYGVVHKCCLKAPVAGSSQQPTARRQLQQASVAAPHQNRAAQLRFHRPQKYTSHQIELPSVAVFSSEQSDALSHMCEWCRYTRGRFERTHGDVLDGHATPPQHHDNAHKPQTTPQTPHALPHTTQHNSPKLAHVGLSRAPQVHQSTHLFLIISV